MILSACYMLWLYQRVFYGETAEEVRVARSDLKPREWAAGVPLIAMMVWMGVYSQSFLPPVSKSDRARSGANQNERAVPSADPAPPHARSEVADAR